MGKNKAAHAQEMKTHYRPNIQKPGAQVSNQYTTDTVNDKVFHYNVHHHDVLHHNLEKDEYFNKAGERSRTEVIKTPAHTVQTVKQEAKTFRDDKTDYVTDNVYHHNVHRHDVHHHDIDDNEYYHYNAGSEKTQETIGAYVPKIEKVTPEEIVEVDTDFTLDNVYHTNVHHHDVLHHDVDEHEFYNVNAGFQSTEEHYDAGVWPGTTPAVKPVTKPVVPVTRPVVPVVPVTRPVVPVVPVTRPV